jgi:hypothetical protein
MWEASGIGEIPESFHNLNKPGESEIGEISDSLELFKKRDQVYSLRQQFGKAICGRRRESGKFPKPSIV